MKNEEIFFRIFRKIASVLLTWYAQSIKTKEMKPMGQLFESIMLICFGLSWPLNVAKNIRAKTAKGMSLPFILLIVTGYIAGIAAKLITHQITYVLIVYFINLAIVAVNILVYFRNVALDKKGGHQYV